MSHKGELQILTKLSKRHHVCPSETCHTIISDERPQLGLILAMYFGLDQFAICHRSWNVKSDGSLLGASY